MLLTGETWCFSQWQQHASDWFKEGKAERDAVKTDNTTDIKTAKKASQKWEEEKDTGVNLCYLLLFYADVMNLLYPKERLLYQTSS